jgi:sulfatase modifying factor 1
MLKSNSQDHSSSSTRETRNSADMIFIPGGAFRMGSDKHYAEEAPVHTVAVGDFWIDRTPVTNREFRKFIDATGYVTFAEIAPASEDYPGALPHMLRPGSLVFNPPDHPVDTRDWMQWWTFKFGANWRRLRKTQFNQRARRSPRRSCHISRCCGLC